MIILQDRFKPNRLSNCVLWLDGSDPLYQSAAPADNTSIQTIANKGYGSVTVTQSTAGSRAVYRSNIYNGKGIIRNTSSQFYTVSGLTFGTSNTIFMVCTPSTVTNGYLWSGSAAGSTPAFISKFNPGSGTQNYEWYNSTDRYTLSTAATGLNVCEVTQTDGVNTSVLFNGVSAANYTPTVTMNTKTMTFLFRATSTLNPSATDMAALLVFTPALTTTQASWVRRYLGNYFGVAVS